MIRSWKRRRGDPRLRQSGVGRRASAPDTQPREAYHQRTVSLDVRAGVIGVVPPVVGGMFGASGYVGEFIVTLARQLGRCLEQFSEHGFRHGMVERCA